MKRVTLLVLTVVLLIGTVCVGQIASNVDCFAYPCSLPNSDKTVDFGTARDGLINGLVMGGPISTRSRVGLPTGVEIRNVFEASDICVSASSTLWRSSFNPPSPYDGQFGQRGYCPVVAIGRDGKISVDMIRYRVFCGIGALGNQSSLAGLSYSVSRVGIESGPDGVLFTPDDVIKKSGLGTDLVDAIVFIGARVGARVEQQSDIDLLLAAIGSDGTYADFQYEFVTPVRTITKGFRVGLVRTLPNSWKIEPFVGPKGMLFSVVGPAGMAPTALLSARRVDGPWTATAATEGTSLFLPYTGNSTNDCGFCRLVP